MQGHLRSPASGHIPRGYTGGFGDVADIRLVVCVAEPGNPKPGESYVENMSAELLVDDIVTGVADAYSKGAAAFHRNIRFILDCCWPNLSLDEQLKRTWITETTLCSAPVSTGQILQKVEQECIKRYLKPQLHLLPEAFILALGRKADTRLRRENILPHFTAWAAGMPGGGKDEAKSSWKEAGQKFQEYLNLENRI